MSINSSVCNGNIVIVILCIIPRRMCLQKWLVFMRCNSMLF